MWPCRIIFSCRKGKGGQDSRGGQIYNISLPTSLLYQCLQREIKPSERAKKTQETLLVAMFCDPPRWLEKALTKGTDGFDKDWSDQIDKGEEKSASDKISLDRCPTYSGCKMMMVGEWSDHDATILNIWASNNGSSDQLQKDQTRYEYMVLVNSSALLFVVLLNGWFCQISLAALSCPPSHDHLPHWHHHRTLLPEPNARLYKSTNLVTSCFDYIILLFVGLVGSVEQSRCLVLVCISRPFPLLASITETL
jgi:hypothetical protein